MCGMTRFQTWLASLAATVVTVGIAYAWIDRPVSFYAHAHLAQYRFFGQLPHLAEWLFGVAVVVFVVAGIVALLGRPLCRCHRVLLLASVSLTASATIKETLKFVFGRTWPETWTNNNPSLIQNGVYGFNPFQGGNGWYSSFPSGHTTAACAAMSVLWICFPRYRPLYVIFVALVVGGLIGANYHFVSDIIAGGFIGISTGYVSVLLGRSFVDPQPAIAAPKPKPQAGKKKPRRRRASR